MSIKIIRGDILTNLPTDKEVYICQQVNCRGVMGAGLAKQIRTKWPAVYNEYSRVINVCDKWMLGTYQSVKVGSHLYVVNLFGQDDYGRDKRYTNYAALTTALFRTMKENPHATFRIPYGLGCGLAGGDWKTVFNIIKEVSNTWDVDVEIWVLPQK